MSRTVESIRRSLDPALAKRFSEVDLLIMSCLCDGMSNAEMARHCGMPESIIKTRMAEIMRKTGTSNRTQIAIWTMKRCGPGISRPRASASCMSEP